MRAVITALGLCLLAAPGWAQSDMSGQALDLVATTSDLDGRTLDLEGRMLDLVRTVEDLGGVAQDLAAKTQDLRISETDTEIRLELASDVLFGFDSAEIQPKAVAALKQVAAFVREKATGGEITIEGHTDAKGKESYNQALSERRAQSVKDWLVGTEGLTEVQIVTRGYGETRPVAPNEKPDRSDDPEGRQKNRRVEIVVLKQ